MRTAIIALYENDYISVPWERAEDLEVLSHEITEMEASKLMPSCCGIVSSRSIRCSDCPVNHRLRVSEEQAWPPPHAFASVAFGCGIELKEDWLTLNADQCWCLLKHAIYPSSSRPSW